MAEVAGKSLAAEANRIKEKYPGRYPVLCTPLDETQGTSLAKSKYLVPGELTMGQFLFILRKRIKADPNQSLVLYIKNGKDEDAVPKVALKFQDAYKDYHSDDGFLRLNYGYENSFGA